VNLGDTDNAAESGNFVYVMAGIVPSIPATRLEPARLSVCLQEHEETSSGRGPSRGRKVQRAREMSCVVVRGKRA